MHLFYFASSCPSTCSTLCSPSVTMLATRSTSMTTTLTTPALVGIRRYASLKVRSAPTISSTVTQMPRTVLPFEVLDRTIELYVDEYRKGDTPVPFAAINALSQVSHTIRQTVFRYFFRRVSANNPRHWAGIFYVLARIKANSLLKNGPLIGFRWVRYGVFLRLIVAHIPINSLKRRMSLSFSSSRALSASAATICHSPERLLLFETLASLSLDLSHEGITSQAHAMKRIFGLINPTTSQMCSSLRSLRLTKVAYIDKRILEMIAYAFPYLQDLYLETTSRMQLSCCSNCYEDSLTLTQHSPIPRYFPIVQSLAVSFHILYRL
jgi:hypothetical protein